MVPMSQSGPGILHSSAVSPESGASEFGSSQPLRAAVIRAEPLSVPDGATPDCQLIYDCWDLLWETWKTIKRQLLNYTFLVTHPAGTHR